MEWNLLSVLYAVLASCFLLPILVFIFVMNWPSYRTYRLINKIPGPPGWPIIGYSLTLALTKTQDLIDLLIYLSDSFPRLAKLWLFGYPVVFVHEPEDLEVLMGSSQHITKGLEYQPFFLWLNEGLLTSTGVKWHSRRKMLTNAFHFRILEDSLPIFNKNAVLLTQKLLKTSNNPTQIDTYVKLCTLDVICEAANGISLGAQNDQGKEYVSSIENVTQIIVNRVISFWMYNDLMFHLNPLGRQFRKGVRLIKNFTDKVICERRSTYFNTPRIPVKTPKKKTAFLDTLLEVEMKSPGTLTQDDIREEVDTFTFEGYDTTSASIIFTLFLLGNHPEIQDKVAEELFEIFGDSERSAEIKDLHRMSYLEKVIKESLRLYPSVPYFSRYLLNDLKLAGDVVVPRGANVAVTPFTVHRNKRFYPDPEKFDPERFSEEQSQKRHPFAYIPFSAGPRNCIGQKFAMMELKVVLSTMLRRAVVESVTKKEDMKLLPFVILKPSEPILIKVRPRVN